MINIGYMKKIYLLLLAAIPIAAVAQEQTYDSLLDGEKIWTIKSVGSDLESTVSYVEYKLMEETSFDGIAYKRLLRRSKWKYEDEWSEWKWLYNKAYIGEDNDGKVYYYIDDDYSIDNDVTMDFSLQVGNVFQLYEEGSSSYVVTAVSDTILENSFDRKPRKCIHLSRTINGEIFYEEWNREVWIEGIGSLRDGLLGTTEYGGASHQLIKCTQQGNIIYQYDDATSVQGIKEQPLEDVSIYNLAGQKVNASYKGIVIRNGKKVIVKYRLYQ